MIHKLLIFILIFSQTSCLEKTNKSESFEVINTFYKAYNSKDYEQFDKIIDNNIQVIEMNNTVLNSKNDFINLVKRGEVLNSKNKKKSIKKKHKTYVVEETQDSEQIQFLYGQPLKAKTTFTIKNEKISIIQVNLIDFDSNKMNKKRNEFMAWLKTNHPDKLAGINQLNEGGGKIFKEAMLLYKKRNK